MDAEKNSPHLAGSPFKTEVLGAPIRPWADLYHLMLRGSWTWLVVVALASYVATAAFFGLFYYLDPGGITGSDDGFLDAMWFSVHTLSTIGYGTMSPVTDFTNVIVTVESFVGLAGTAVVTALMFAKFARPTARVVFSRSIVVHTTHLGPVLQVRLANERANQILDGRLHLSAMVEERGLGGVIERRLVDLHLVREHLPLLTLAWSGTHLLDPHSPLHGLGSEAVRRRLVFVLASFSGTDDTYLQTVHARHLYQPDDLVFDHRFGDIVDSTDSGVLRLHLDRLDEVVPVGDLP